MQRHLEGKETPGKSNTTIVPVHPTIIRRRNELLSFPRHNRGGRESFPYEGIARKMLPRSRRYLRSAHSSMIAPTYILRIRDPINLPHQRVKKSRSQPSGDSRSGPPASPHRLDAITESRCTRGAKGQIAGPWLFALFSAGNYIRRAF